MPCNHVYVHIYIETERVGIERERERVSIIREIELVVKIDLARTLGATQSHFAGIHKNNEDSDFHASKTQLTPSYVTTYLLLRESLI